MAQQRLVDPTVSIQQVGYDVGFTSTTAFHRAFKRWTGESPAAFRTSARPSDDPHLAAVANHWPPRATRLAP